MFRDILAGKYGVDLHRDHLARFAGYGSRAAEFWRYIERGGDLPPPEPLETPREAATRELSTTGSRIQDPGGLDDRPDSTVGFDQDTYVTFQERLLRWGISASAQLLNDDAYAKLLNARLVIDEVALDTEFGNYAGILPEQLRVEASAQESPRLPDYVYEKRAMVPEPDTNKQLVYLESWDGLILDRSNSVRLVLGSHDSCVAHNRYDFRTSLAAWHSASQIQHDILTGKLRFGTFGRRLNTVTTVVTSDNRVIFGKRSRRCENTPGQWLTSIGEAIELPSDLVDGLPQPLKTVRRALCEVDELNLTQQQAHAATIRFLGISTEWRFMYATLFAFAELKSVSFAQVRDQWRPGEISHIESLPFTLDACLPVVQSGVFTSDGLGDTAPMDTGGRLNLLLCLMARYGREVVEARIG